MLPTNKDDVSPSVVRFGPELTNSGVTFHFWAPKHDKVALKIIGEGTLRDLKPVGKGWYQLEVPNAGPGTKYSFVLPDGLEVPDPASRFQPDDVHGPSEVVNPDGYAWTDDQWAGRPWEEIVVYELHIGTFTGEGTFRAAIERLDHLHDLGVTAIEIMPVADFPGERNWGYDGVLLYAPDSSYGRPEDFKALVDAAHQRGIAVLLDVVYNHFGPDGNYLPTYSPILTEKHKTPWGAAVNYDAEGSEFVREFIIQNAAYWIGEFHLDGLRLDAVHAIKDESEEHLLEAIARRARQAASNRHIHLVLENEENEASRLQRGPEGRPKQFTAQWNDDIHHVLHAAASGDRNGYYADYHGDDDKLGRALAEGFAFQGELMPYRGEPRGEPSASLPPTSFVSFIQNHDQVGNRAFGDRITDFAPHEAVRAVAAVYLLSPQIPMIFMGEEWGAAHPFQFFCDFEGELSDAVRNGRRSEFSKFPEFQDPEMREQIPDPTARETFVNSKLDWGRLDQEPHRGLLEFYRELLSIRRTEIVPRLRGIGGNCGSYEVIGPQAVSVHWRMGDGSTLSLLANLNSANVRVNTSEQGRLIFSVGESFQSSIGPWAVQWSLR